MPTAKLIYADTHRSADQLYLSGVQVPDAFISIVHRNEKIGILSALEYDRVKREGAFDRLLPLEDVELRCRERFNIDRPLPGHHAALLAAEEGITAFEVGADFPALVLRQMEQLCLDIEVAPGSVFPGRACKSREEAEAIREGNDASSAGFRAVEALLGAASISDGLIFHDGEPLTSERVRFEIEVACLKRGALALDTIVAGGDQACDPHGRGTGPLRANELIIVDIFPRVSATGYHGDMTRTYLKGTPSDEQRKLVATVHEAQKRAIGGLREGADGVALYRQTVDYFNEQGYRTGKVNGVHTGFFHGLGHGLGLEVHEPPRMSRIGAILQSGHVVTIEPGLYYPGLGGCRIEDVAWITPTGYELISSHPYDWVY